MNKFERMPQESQKPDPVGAMEELKAGKFAMTAEDRERITKQAKEQGRNPEEALQEYQQKLEQATARIRASQSEEAVKSLERAAGEAEKKEDQGQ